MSYFRQLISGFGIHLVNKAKDPFEPFEYWLVDGPAGIWPDIWSEDKTLSLAQKKTVSANAKLLAKEGAWKKRVNAFESALVKVGNDRACEKKRAMYEIRFDRHEFDMSGFGGRVFPVSVSFREVKFPRAVHFDNVKFLGIAHFYKIEFIDTVNFEAAVFSKAADFSSAIFSDVAYFANVKFSGEASFINAKFLGTTNFGCTEFSATANFYISKFSNLAEFAGALFSGEAFFSNAIFSGVANFPHTKFKKDLNFRGTEFHSACAISSGVEVEGNLFVRSMFAGSADFSRLEVKGTTSLSGSEFHQIPDFTDAKLDRPPDIAGMVVPQPETQKDKWWQFRQAVKSDDVVKLRKLKSMALDASDHEKDGEFFAKEMLAKRGWETTSFSGLLFNTLYWKLSDFGQSFVRPLVGLFFSLSIFPILYLVAVFWGQLRYPNSDEVYLALQLSMRNFLPFFGSLFRFSPRPKEHNSAFMNTYHDLVNKGLDADWLVAIGIVQNIIGAVLLFLFLLALRNKFRLK